MVMPSQRQVRVEVEVHAFVVPHTHTHRCLDGINSNGIRAAGMRRRHKHRCFDGTPRRLQDVAGDMQHRGRSRERLGRRRTTGRDRAVRSLQLAGQ